MKEFMFIIRGGLEIERSQAEFEDHMQKWQKFMGALVEQDKLVGGQPLKMEGSTWIESGTKQIDRPLAEGKELVGGYLIVKAGSMKEASELALGCPSFEYGCTIEVREIMEL